MTGLAILKHVLRMTEPQQRVGRRVTQYSV